MVRKSCTPEQIINKLREAEIHINRGISISGVSRKIGVTEQTYYRWRKEYSDLRIEEIIKFIFWKRFYCPNDELLVDGTLALSRLVSVASQYSCSPVQLR